MNQSLRSMKNALRKEMRMLLNQIPLEVIEHESMYLVNFIMDNYNPIKVLIVGQRIILIFFFKTIGSIVTEKLINSEEYLTSNHISIYISMPKGESSTKQIIKDIFERGLYFIFSLISFFGF